MAIEAVSNSSMVSGTTNGYSSTVAEYSNSYKQAQEQSVSQSVENTGVTVNIKNPFVNSTSATENDKNNASDDDMEQGRYEVENGRNVSSDKLKQAVDEINQKIKPTHTSCQFSYHEETNRISIKVIDDDTDEVIREIPPEKTLDMIAKHLKLEGVLVDEKR